MRSYDALSIGGLRGVRGSRLIDPEARGSPMAASSPGIKIVQGDELLRELERERKQLRIELLKSKDTFSAANSYQPKKESSHPKTRPVKEEYQAKVYNKNNFVNLESSKSAQRREFFHQLNKTKAQSDQNSTEKTFKQKFIPKALKIGSEIEEPIDVTAENQFEILNDIMCPLLEMPYEEQVAIKSRKHEEFMTRLLKQAPSSSRKKMGTIITSEVLTEYRNKDEFGIQKVFKSRHLFGSFRLHLNYSIQQAWAYFPFGQSYSTKTY